MNFEHAIRAGRLVPGMNFNQRVWALTSRIERGKVVTYADLAHALGTKAYRAVGNAMNRNPYAPGVPCHRVVGSSGALTGYAHGLPAKEKLLRDEGVTIAGGRVSREFRMSLDPVTDPPPAGRAPPPRPA